MNFRRSQQQGWTQRRITNNVSFELFSFVSESKFSYLSHFTKEKKIYIYIHREREKEGERIIHGRVDMEFLFSCSTRHLTRLLRSLVCYRVKHSTRNSISTRPCIILSPSFSLSLCIYIYIFFSFVKWDK